MGEKIRAETNGMLTSLLLHVLIFYKNKALLARVPIMYTLTL